MSVFIWLPNDPHNFVLINYKELAELADTICGSEWNKEEFREYAVSYFLIHPVKYDKKKARISTYLHETMKFIGLKYRKEVVDDIKDRYIIEKKVGLVPMEYLEDRKEIMSESEEASDAALDIRTFKRYLKRNYKNKCSWIVNGLKVMDLKLYGYKETEVAEILNVTTVRVSQLKRYLKVKDLEFLKKESKLCAI